MKLSYRSYTEFVLKADVLVRELSLNPEDAANLLAQISGYKGISTMPLGAPMMHSIPSRDLLLDRLLTWRQDICLEQAEKIIDKLYFLCPAS